MSNESSVLGIFERTYRERWAKMCVFLQGNAITPLDVRGLRDRELSLQWVMFHYHRCCRHDCQLDNVSFLYLCQSLCVCCVVYVLKTTTIHVAKADMARLDISESE